MKPVIGISVDCKHDPSDLRYGGKLELNWNYAEAVSRAGGVPILVPPTADMAVVAPLIDGWLIPGGADIDAKHFGQPNHPKAELQDPARFDAEARLFQVIPPDLPVLGICYGCQFLNVMGGGDLIQHVPDVVGHEAHSGGTLQEYAIEQSSQLAGLVGTNLMKGKSYHHQAIGRIASDYRVVGRHPDGTVEAIESTGRPWVIGVQWHPERSPEDGPTQRLFEEFVAAATRFRQRRKGD